MAVQATPYAPPLAAAGLAFAATAIWLARRTDRGLQSTWLAVPLFVATAAWTLGYAAELTVTGYAAQLLFARVQYLGNATAPVLWFAYVAAYVGYADSIPRWAWGALATPPIVVLALVATYPSTTLVWEGVEQVTVGGDVLLDTHYGPLFYAFMAYVYALVLAATGLLVERVRSTQGIYRRQAWTLLAGSVVPAIAGVVYVADVSPLPAVNLPALGFVATGGVVAYSVRHSDLFTLEPVAWETAVAELDDPVFVVDSRERVAAANPAARAFAGADVGTTADDALGDVFEEPYWRQPGEHTCEYDDGTTTRALSVSVTPVDRDGVTAGHVLVVRDVTERERRERRLAEFASVVSHDLRNPLNVAHGHLELGRESGDDQHFREVDGALDRMEHIIEDLLTLAREGDATPDAEPVSLAAAAETAWASVESTGAEATLEVGEDTMLVADETAFVRLLENLFRNSTEHAGCDVTVSVGATEDGFFVEDDGSGIPAENRESVFESGYTTSDGGTGFGLSIVDEIADSHGWTVDLVDGESGGARFEFGT
jgi:nitrogen-specific signal transduction histidine kinase